VAVSASHYALRLNNNIYYHYQTFLKKLLGKLFIMKYHFDMERYRPAGDSNLHIRTKKNKTVNSFEDAQTQIFRELYLTIF
jgi:hypothetical protein